MIRARPDFPLRRARLPLSLRSGRFFRSFFGHGLLLYQKMIRHRLCSVHGEFTECESARRTAQSEWRTMKRANEFDGWQRRALMKFYGNRHHTSIIHKGKWLFFDSLKHVRTRLEFPILAPDSRYSCNHHVITYFLSRSRASFPFLSSLLYCSGSTHCRHFANASASSLPSPSVSVPLAPFRAPYIKEQ